jgi:hypothetical protein
MLLETLAPPTIAPPTFTEPTETGPAGGIVTMTIVSDKLPVLLSGSGPNWSTQASTLYLTPLAGETLPLWYSFILQIDPKQPYMLLAAKVYPKDVPADANATLYYPVSSDGTVTLNLLHNLPAGSQSVSYMLEIGYSDGTDSIWIPDPTITFDPQG